MNVNAQQGLFEQARQQLWPLLVPRFGFEIHLRDTSGTVRDVCTGVESSYINRDSDAVVAIAVYQGRPVAQLRNDDDGRYGLSIVEQLVAAAKLHRPGRHED